MNDLLDSAVAAHGGLDRWNQVRSIAFDASITRAFWHLKGKGDALKDVHLEVDTTRQLVTIESAGQDKRAVFEPHRVVVQRGDGALIEAREEPFLAAWPGFATEEIAPIEADGETWRRLEVTFPDHIKSHTRRLILCFGPDGLLRRHDFTIDLLGAVPPSQLYASGYRDVDGIILPATRRAYAERDGDQLVMVAIDMSEITIR